MDYGVDGLVVRCRHCNCSFGICKSCWRGDRYCSVECRASQQKISHRQSQKEYSKTAGGRERQRINQKAYRDREKISVSDEPSKVEDFGLNPVITSDEFCRFCERALEPRYWLKSEEYFSFSRSEVFKNANC